MTNAASSRIVDRCIKCLVPVQRHTSVVPLVAMTPQQAAQSELERSPVLDRVRSALGPAAYDRGGALIYQGDCVDVLPKLGQLVKLTVTSPPYNIGKEYETRLPLEKYLDWTEQWVRLVYKATAPDGAFWLNLGYISVEGRGKAIPIPYLVWERIPFFLIQEVVWNYGAGVASRRSFSPRNEKFLWYVRNPNEYVFNLDDVRDPDVKYPRQFKNGRLKVNPLGKNPTDVWTIPKVTSGEKRSSKERTPHPAQFPIAVVERIVKACSNAGDLVLDPFVGSGSTAYTCLELGRPFIGVEIEQRYIDIAGARLDALLDGSP
jgi:adenine-specific DNA-methyltransferase